MEVVIAALNEVLGATNFVILHLREGFKVHLVNEFPEINSLVKSNGVSWVSDGYGDYILSKEDIGAIMEIRINDSRKTKIFGRPYFLKDHEIIREKTEERTSPFRKRESRAVIALYCPITRRSIKIELIGKHSHYFADQIEKVVCH